MCAPLHDPFAEIVKSIIYQIDTYYLNVCKTPRCNFFLAVWGGLCYNKEWIFIQRQVYLWIIRKP